VLEKSSGSQIRAYLERKAAFNRHRRKVKADFDKLYRLFESDLSFNKIAEVAGVSKPRIVEIFRLHFAQFFSVSGSKRRRDIAKRRKDEVANRVARLISKDPVLNAIKASAARAKRKRTIEPIILNRGDRLQRDTVIKPFWSMAGMWNQFIISALRKCTQEAASRMEPLPCSGAAWKIPVGVSLSLTFPNIDGG
jgi:hypothetical protein